MVPASDNFFAALNSAVFTDGSFVYIPKGVRCPMELSTYFRINARNSGQFERTLIIAEEGASVSYLEGCTAPQRDENQLHAAIVEIIGLDDATVEYSTVQNWYPGDADGRGGIYNFVTKGAACRGARSKVSWTQVETGTAITWKYPSCILQGEGSVGEFYSVAVTNNRQQADTGTKMIHIGRITRSTIVAKTISAGQSDRTYRGLVRILPRAAGARNFTQCDSLLIGDQCGAHTVPYVESRNPTAQIEHEATTPKINEDQLFYCRQRGLDQEDAVGLIVNGFCKEVLKELPMEFACHPRHSIRLQPRAQLTLVELAYGSGTYLHNSVTTVEVGNGATLTHVRLQDESLDTTHLAAIYAEIDSGGMYDAFTLNLGARLSRTEMHARVFGIEDRDVFRTGTRQASAAPSWPL